MNHDHLFATLAIAATLAAAIPTVHAEYILPSFEEKLQAAADGGPAEVNHLLYRTRAIYNLSMDEAMRHVESHSTAVTPAGETESAPGSESGSAAGGGDATAEPGSAPREDGFTQEFFRNDARD
jgi:hypothetical protein